MLIFVQNLLQNKAQSRRESALNELRIVKGKKIFFVKKKVGKTIEREIWSMAQLKYYTIFCIGKAENCLS